jgi:S-adenosylmethionine:tRNA ribosyltransferase-isomerase
VTRVLRTSDFEYRLPPELIAQVPLPERSASRLLVLERASGTIQHRTFPDLLSFIGPADVVVVNTSRVIPARLRGKREGGQPAELLLVRERDDGTWLALGHPGGKLKPGRRVVLGNDSVVEITAVLGGGLRRVRFVGALDARATLAKYGQVPLPPYIKRAPVPADRERYQTVYAAHDGSVAAPTAGLHFTPELLRRLELSGTALATIELHVGPGTFKPVETEDPRAHRVPPEPYAISAAAAAVINERRARGGRVWAVGTTVVRTLETTADPRGCVRPGTGDTALFIHPPFTFRAVDRLLTNFHLPRSSLLMLVCAFGGYDAVMRAYAQAIEHRYRFYSYGDAMAVV